MAETTKDLERSIRAQVLTLAKQGQPGDPLPRIRDLMTEFGTSQRVVTRALKSLVEGGLIVSRPGAGIKIAQSLVKQKTYEADCLILYRSSRSMLAQNLLLKLVERLQKSGLRVTLSGFTQEKTAAQAIKKLGHFRCCLLQANFEIVSIEFLSEIRKHTDSLVIDGVSVTGIDADVIGTNWREALSVSYRELVGQGHEKIGFLTSSHDARQIAMARREFKLISGWDSSEPHPLLFTVDRLPGYYKSEEIQAILPRKEQIENSQGYSALIVWGLVDGYLMDRALAARSLRSGVDFSVMLMGSIDFQSEHLAHFDTTGNSNDEKLAMFEKVIRARISGDKSPVKTHYLQVHRVKNGSVLSL
ncbi:MAG: hypothetical protein COA47_17510 [Robiginitomaculum sp.]|nr:MAG: hypothetical protein COA47_17510 [Robiginitomaculum sp.]